MTLFKYLCLILVLGWCGCLALNDVRHGRLPNALTIPALLFALACRLGLGGVPMLLDGVLGGVLAALPLLIAFFCSASCAGDVKFMFASGCVVGMANLFPLFSYTILCSMVQAIVVILKNDSSRARIRHALRCMFDIRYDRASGKAALKDAAPLCVRYGVSIAFGTGVTFCLMCIPCLRGLFMCGGA